MSRALVLVFIARSTALPFYAISAKKAEEAAFAWPCSPLRPPVPFFGFACRELELATEAATLLPSSPASSPSFWGGGGGG